VKRGCSARVSALSAFSALAWMTILPDPATAQPAVSARYEAASGGIAGAFRAAASGSGPSWIGYSVPAAGSHHICCADWKGLPDHGSAWPCGRRCSLEESDGFSMSDAADCRTADPGTRLVVFIKVERGTVARVRLFSEDCAVDASGVRVAWLESVPAAESVSFLESLVPKVAADDESERQPWTRALAAIALHGDASSDDAFDRLTSASSPEAVRKKAVFWLGNARGARGYERLRRLSSEEPSENVRKQVTFGLSQSPVPGAVDTLIRMARGDASPRVRSQALFWLAQKAGRRAIGAIDEAIRDDPETEVKRKAVFALTQLPADESVTQLIRVAKTNRNPAVRKRAIFWLGQSKEPRALAYLEEVLTAN
jgi:hypothetical protein